MAGVTPTDRHPIGSSGLNRFTEDLDLDWRFEADEEGPVEPISHCYALNVDGEDAWACTYTEFDVVRVRDGVIRSWTSETDGPTALAVDQDRIVLLGGYGSGGNRVLVARFGETGLEPIERYRAALPNAKPLPANADILGRGFTLHAFTDSDWYQLSVDEVRRRRGGRCGSSRPALAVGNARRARRQITLRASAGPLQLVLLPDWVALQIRQRREHTR